MGRLRRRRSDLREALFSGGCHAGRVHLAGRDHRRHDRDLRIRSRADLDRSYSFWASFGDSSAYIGAGVAEVTRSTMARSCIGSRHQIPAFSRDAPFCIVTDDIDAPVTGSPPDSKPAIPIVKCIPSKTIEASPKAAAGCNQGGVGFTIGDAAQKASVGLRKRRQPARRVMRTQQPVTQRNRLRATLAEAGFDKTAVEAAGQPEMST